MASTRIIILTVSFLLSLIVIAVMARFLPPTWGEIVLDISREPYVERDLMLVKISCTAEKRGELRQLVEIFRGRVVDIGPSTMMVEISGTEDKIEAFIDLIRPYGVLELARSGRIALVRECQPLDHDS